MTRCTIDQALLEKTKLDKVLPKLLKKGDEKVQALVRKVLDNVSTSSKPKDSSRPGEQTTEPRTELAKGGLNGKLSTGLRTAEPQPHLKRPRDSSSSTAPPAKKSVIAGSSRASSGAAVKSIPVKGSQLVKTDTKSSNLTPAPKNKANHVAIKPSSLFANLQSASKKPGTSIAAQKAAQESDAKNV